MQTNYLSRKSARLTDRGTSQKRTRDDARETPTDRHSWNDCSRKNAIFIDDVCRRGVLNDGGGGGGGNEAKVGRWGNALALKKCINNNNNNKQ